MNQGLDLVGRQIGAYRVDSLIGAGGYSRVYRGLDENVGRSAAIKVLLPAHGDDGYSETVIQRFEREARIVANLRDPHSVQLFEYGQTDDGMLYMIFEFIEGDTLEEVRRRDGALPALRVVKILEQVLLSLEEAHTMGLVHRDIKPANIMVFEHIGRKDQVKVLDFGVGKAVGADSSADDITKAGVLIGTPRYMAPEQWSSDGEISQQTDIYSLGLVIYELLTGERAINATEPVHIMKAHIDPTPIVLPEDLDLPSGFRRVVNTMLQKGSDERYESATEVLADLTRLKPVGTHSDTLETDEAELARQDDAPTAEVVEREESTQVDTAPGAGEKTLERDGRNLALITVLIAAALVTVLGTVFMFGGDASEAGVVVQEATDEPSPEAKAENTPAAAMDDSEAAAQPQVQTDEQDEVGELVQDDKPYGDDEASDRLAQGEGEEPTDPEDDPGEAVAENAADEVDQANVAAPEKQRAPRRTTSKTTSRKTERRAPRPSARDKEKSGTGGNLILYPADE